MFYQQIKPLRALSLKFIFCLAIVFDKNTSTEIQDLVERAMVKINSGIKYGRNKWSVQINVIDVI
jgi:hypothetical protein